MLGEAAVAPLLVPDPLAVDVHDEVAAAAGDELDLDRGVLPFDRGSQTGRPGLVVSNRAILDRHMHVASLTQSGLNGNA